MSGPVGSVDRIGPILERVSPADIMARRFGPAVRQQGGRLTWPCPHPDHPDAKPSFTVDLTGTHAGSWRCWSRCNVGGDTVDLVKWLDRCPTSDAVRKLAEMAGIHDSPRSAPKPRPATAVRQPERDLPSEAWSIVDNMVAEREWCSEVVPELGIRPAMVGGRVAVRFPFRKAGVEVSYADRQFGREPKWLNAHGPIPCPYEADRLAIGRERGQIIVVEGITDTVAILSEHPDAAVIGCPGVGVFKGHWGKALAGLHVYVIADNDPAGGTMRDRVAAACAAHAAGVHQVFVPDDWHDVDEWRRGVPDRFEWHEQLGDALDAGAASLKEAQ